MKIVGTSGVSVLLAGQVMLRHKPVIYLKDKELVNNHSAVLRFKSDEISKFLNIPFKKVTIDKAIYYKDQLLKDSNLFLQNMYSQKVTGRIMDRSIRDMRSEVRYIAPDNFMELLTIGLDIRTGCDIMEEAFKGDDVVLSYIKMPDMMKHLNIEPPKFEFKPVYTANVKISNPITDIYQTIYFPGNEIYYRASITKDNLIIEYIDEPACIEQDIEFIVRYCFGIKVSEFGPIKYAHLPLGKMSPIDDNIRKEFIGKLTIDHNIWSFGRNGIWKSIRLDSLYDDLHRIDKMLRSSKYYRSQII